MTEKETFELLEAMIADMKTNIAELKTQNSLLMQNLCSAMSLLENANLKLDNQNDTKG